MLPDHPLNPALGLNLGSMGPYGSGLQTLDLMKGADAWGLLDPATWAAAPVDPALLDAEGWPTAMATLGGVTQHWATRVTYSEALPKGQYVITWKGEGSFETFLEVTDRQDHRITVTVDDRWDSPDLPDGIILLITDTDPNHTGDYLRDIKVFRAEDEARVEAGEIWRPEFLDKVGDFRVLRTMEMLDTNSSHVTRWDATQQGLDKVTWSEGAPLAAMIDLANETNADLWLNVPHLADDDYVRQMATTIRETLEPGLKVYLEYSNEHWTWGFEQSRWFLAQGKAEYGDVGFEWPQYYIARAAEVAQVFGDSFGAENAPRYVPLFTIGSGFIGWQPYVDALLNAPAAVAHGGTGAIGGPFKAVAVDTYFDGGVGWDENYATVRSWLDQGQDYALNRLYETILAGSGLPRQTSFEQYRADLASWGAIAQQNGWSLLSYEGGTAFSNFGHRDDQAYTDLMLAMNRNPRISLLAHEVIDGFKAAGGTIMAHFADFGLDGWFGNWGTWSSVFADQPAGRGLPALEANAEAPWYADPRPGSFFLDDRLQSQARPLLGTEDRDWLAGSEGADIIQGLAGDDGLTGNADDDRIFGGAGDDWLHGNAGNDLLAGGDGNDAMVGHDGDDTILGGAGHDTAWSDAGDDSLDGGAGDDSLWAGDGADNLYGGLGDDTLNGARDDDLVAGDAGDDSLFGDTGRDLLIGGDGCDRIDGAWDNDTMTGGAGADVFVLDRWYGDDVITDFTPGQDRLDLTIFADYAGADAWATLAADLMADAEGNAVLDLWQFGTRVALAGVSPSTVWLSTDLFLM